MLSHMSIYYHWSIVISIWLWNLKASYLYKKDTQIGKLLNSYARRVIRPNKTLFRIPSAVGKVFCLGHIFRISIFCQFSILIWLGILGILKPFPVDNNDQLSCIFNTMVADALETQVTSEGDSI